MVGAGWVAAVIRLRKIGSRVRLGDIDATVIAANLSGDPISIEYRLLWVDGGTIHTERVADHVLPEPNGASVSVGF